MEKISYNLAHFKILRLWLKWGNVDWVRLKSRDGSAAGDEAEVEVTTIRGKNKNTEIRKYRNVLVPKDNNNMGKKKWKEEKLLMTFLMEFFTKLYFIYFLNEYNIRTN